MLTLDKMLPAVQSQAGTGHRAWHLWQINGLDSELSVSHLGSGDNSTHFTELL